MLFLCAPGCRLHDPEDPGLLVPATVEEDPTLPCVHLAETSLHVQTYGDPGNPKLFVLEGGPGSDFRYMLGLLDPVDQRRLQDEYFVIFHDYRGSGLSKRHPIDEISLDVLRTDFEALVAHFETDEEEPILLLGHSHGGLLAVQYIQAHPERVAGAVLVEPGEFSGQILKHQPELVEVDLLDQGVHDLSWVRQFLGARDHIMADYWVAIVRASLDQAQRGDSTHPSAKSWRRGAAALLAIPLGEQLEYAYDFTPGLEAFEGPVLFVSSDGSQDLGYTFQQRAHLPFFPQARHQLIEGTGHDGLIQTHQAATLSHVFSFLDALEQRQAP